MSYDSYLDNREQREWQVDEIDLVHCPGCGDPECDGGQDCPAVAEEMRAIAGEQLARTIAEEQVLFPFAETRCRWCKRVVDRASATRGVGGFYYCDEEHAELEAMQYDDEEVDHGE